GFLRVRALLLCFLKREGGHCRDRRWKAFDHWRLKLFPGQSAFQKVVLMKELMELIERIVAAAARKTHSDMARALPPGMELAGRCPHDDLVVHNAAGKEDVHVCGGLRQMAFGIFLRGPQRDHMKGAVLVELYVRL